LTELDLSNNIQRDTNYREIPGTGFSGVGTISNFRDCVKFLIQSLKPRVHSGEVSNEVFALLCRLNYFDLSRNPGLDRSTPTGYFACTMTNLKDSKRIDAHSSGYLKGDSFR